MAVVEVRFNKGKKEKKSLEQAQHQQGEKAQLCQTETQKETSRTLGWICMENLTLSSSLVIFLNFVELYNDNGACTHLKPFVIKSNAINPF